MSQDVVSFVLRFVRDAGQDSQARWRGKVQHVQGSAERQFSQFSEALAFMQEHMNSAAEAAAQDGAKLAQNNPWLETAKLWGEFVPQYNRLVLENMSEMSSLWQAPAEANGEQSGENLEPKNLNSKLDALSKQLAALTNAVEQVQQDVDELKKKNRTNKKEK